MSETPETFEQHRPFLEKLALRLCKSSSDAQDLIQETFIRWKRLSPEAVENPRGMLTTIMARQAINQQTSARARREVVSEPDYARDLQDARPPEDSDLSDALVKAFELVLTRMGPTERAVFLLREVFEWDYAQISDALGHSEANCRQILRRARQHVFASTSRFRLSPGEDEELVEEFLSACQSGNVDALLRSLHGTAVLLRDAGDIGELPPPPLEAPDQIREFVSHLLRTTGRDNVRVKQVGPHHRIVLFSKGDQLQCALLCLTESSRVKRIHHIACPTRLRLVKRICQI